MSALGDADASLTSGAPLLGVAEPALFLLALAFGALGRAVGNADAFDPLRLRSGLVLGREECGVRCHQMWRASQQCLMCLDGGDQQVRIIWPPRVDLVIGDDLVLRLLQFHHLAELVGLAGLAPRLRGGRLLRMTSVDGSNRLRSLPSLRVLPRKMRALVCFITCLTSDCISSSSWRRPSNTSCFKAFVDRFTPRTISSEKRFACPTTRPVASNNCR